MEHRYDRRVTDMMDIDKVIDVYCHNHKRYERIIKNKAGEIRTVDERS